MRPAATTSTVLSSGKTPWVNRSRRRYARGRSRVCTPRVDEIAELRALVVIALLVDRKWPMERRGGGEEEGLYSLKRVE
jgi:hypothetical protein